jgi:hypothetical protein
MVESRRITWAEHAALAEGMNNTYKMLLVRKPEGKSPFGRLRRRREDNIKIDLKEIVWEGADWIHLA